MTFGPTPKKSPHEVCIVQYIHEAHWLLSIGKPGAQLDCGHRSAPHLEWPTPSFLGAPANEWERTRDQTHCAVRSPYGPCRVRALLPRGAYADRRDDAERGAL